MAVSLVESPNIFSDDGGGRGGVQAGDRQFDNFPRSLEFSHDIMGF